MPGAEEAPCDLGRNITILRRRKLVQRAQGSLSHAKFSSGSGMNTSQSVGGNADVNSFAGPKVISAMTNGRIQPADFGSGLSHLFGELFQEAYLRMCYAVKKLLPCQVCCNIIMEI